MFPSRLPHEKSVLGSKTFTLTRELYPTIVEKTEPKADQHEVIPVRYSHMQNLDLDVLTRYFFLAGGLLADPHPIPRLHPTVELIIMENPVAELWN